MQLVAGILRYSKSDCVVCMCVLSSELSTARQLSPPLCNSISSSCCHCAAAGRHSNQPTFRWLPCSAQPHPPPPSTPMVQIQPTPGRRRRGAGRRIAGLNKMFCLSISAQDKIGSFSVGFAGILSDCRILRCFYLHLHMLCNLAEPVEYVNQLGAKQ